MREIATHHYRGFDFDHNFYGEGEYTIHYCGDDIWCTSLEEAKEVIDDIVENELEDNYIELK